MKFKNEILSIVLLVLFMSGVLASTETFSYTPDESLFLPNYVNPPIIITSDDDFVTYGFSGNGSITNPYIIEDYSIITSSKTSITINDTTNYFVIRDCYLDGMEYGIFINNVSAGTATIEDNTCENNDYTAIYINDAPSSVVKNNYCSNNYIGINFDDSPDGEIRDNLCENIIYAGIYLAFSVNPIIENNTCINNNEALMLHFCGSSVVANNKFYNNGHGCIFAGGATDVEIIDNECINSIYYGIRLGGIDSSNISGNICNDNNISIHLDGCQLNTIMNNTCYNNQNGIYLTSTSDWNILNYNLLQENAEYGVYVALSDDNTIYHNSFKDNNLDGTIHGSSQAYDNGTDNNWYNFSMSEGNYWSDWSGIGGYLIDGIGGSVDIYPLSDSIIPIITEIYQFTLITFIIATVSLISIASIHRKK